MRILLIDDYLPFAQSMEAALSFDHEVTVETSPQRALAVLARESYDVILCDLSMPEISGSDFYEHVKAHGTGLEGRIIFITGGVQNAQMEAFIAAVPNTCIEKPFDLDTLADVLAKVAPRP